MAELPFAGHPLVGTSGLLVGTSGLLAGERTAVAVLRPPAGEVALDRVRDYRV
jgi:predicted PhzF superfamily epimerase YddE/YHI9